MTLTRVEKFKKKLIQNEGDALIKFLKGKTIRYAITDISLEGDLECSLIFEDGKETNEVNVSSAISITIKSMESGIPMFKYAKFSHGEIVK